jgi:hypothetical protein
MHFHQYYVSQLNLVNLVLILKEFKT